MGVCGCRCRRRCSPTPMATPTPIILGVVMPEYSAIRFRMVFKQKASFGCVFHFLADFCVRKL